MTDRPLVLRASLLSRASKYVRDYAQRFLHLLGYYILLSRKGTRLAQVAGFRLTIHPTVYDPRFYRAPAYFAEFIGHLDLSGKRVADLCTGCGIQALAAVRAGAAKVVAIDVNPIAAVTAGESGFDSQLPALPVSSFPSM